jgi:uncharacterized Fe-S radical SAM superfamily protein PflX
VRRASRNDESNKYSSPELERKLDGIIDSNITEIKYEGKKLIKIL